MTTATHPVRTAIKIGPLAESELTEADRIIRLAFGTFLGLPNPLEFMGDRDFLRPRWRAPHVKVIAAHADGRLLGTNILTRWGSFGFFGPLTVHPDFWDRGVARGLLEATVKTFDKWGLRHTGLFTFAHSAKHVGLYQTAGYWPRFLTAVMKHSPAAQPAGAPAPLLLSALSGARRTAAIEACRRVAGSVDKGLDLTSEIKIVLLRRLGEVVLTQTRGIPDGFAICATGPGSEGGASLCYVKFAAVRGGSGAGDRFDKLLHAVDAFAAPRGLAIEAGVNLARADAFLRMRAHGYRSMMQGVAMHRPHTDGFNRPDCYVIDDWR